MVRNTTSISLAASNPRTSNSTPTATFGIAAKTEFPRLAKALRSFSFIFGVLFHFLRIELTHHREPELLEKNQGQLKGERCQLGSSCAALDRMSNTAYQPA